ncbi:MAG: arginine deiminase-related protein [Steroidobacteraceae bacterium]
MAGTVDTVVTAAIPTIATLGGGSVRCMLAEVRLPR